MWQIRGEERNIKRFGWETGRRIWKNDIKIILQEILSEISTVISLT
jgi:hypothetical protein